MDPQVEALLQMMQAQSAGAPAMTTLAPEVARAGAETSFEAFNAGVPESVAIADRIIPGPAGDLAVKIFTPAGEGPFPLVVFFHGGGWVILSPNSHRKLTAELAEGANAVVVSVDYRLAPEHPAPAAADDCYAATLWAVGHAAELNADPQRFALAGDSAGGNLAAVVALRLRDEGGPQARLQLLMYGAFLGDPDTESGIANGEGKILTRDSMVWFYNHYLSGGADPADPYVSPINGDLAGLPPAHLIVGTLDPLLDDSKAYAAKLEAVGVPTTLSIYEDMPHIFLQLSAILDGGKRGLAECCTALRQALA